MNRWTYATPGIGFGGSRCRRDRVRARVSPATYFTGGIHATVSLQMNLFGRAKSQASK